MADVKLLQRYLESELNVRDIVFTSDEKRAGVQYRAVADWAVLGRKLRKDLARVKNGLPSVSSEAVKAYTDRKSTRLNSSHSGESRMPSSA